MSAMMETEPPLVTIIRTGTNINEQLNASQDIVQEFGCSEVLNAQDRDGRTALHWAVFKENLRLVKHLLLGGVDAGLDLKVPDRLGNTPLILACSIAFTDENNRIAIVKALIEADPTPAHLNAQNNDGYTALARAVDRGLLGVITALLESLPIRDRLTSVAHELFDTAYRISTKNMDDRSFMSTFKRIYDSVSAGIVSSRKPYDKQYWLNICVSLEANDWNDSMTLDILGALCNEIPVVCSVGLAHRLVKEAKQNVRIPATVILSSDAWAVFINREEDIVLMVPQIQDKALDWVNHYRLNNVDLIPKDKLYSILSSNKFNKKAVDLNNLRKIFPLKGKQEQPISLRWYMSGHGGLGSSIAGLSIAQRSVNTGFQKFVISDMQRFLSILAELNTEFLYISSCDAGGLNLATLQQQLNEQLALSLRHQNLLQFYTYEGKSIVGQGEDSSSAFQRQGLINKLESMHVPRAYPDYSIVIQATTDAMSSGGTRDLSEFFEKLNAFLNQGSKTQTIASVLEPLYKVFPRMSRLASIRFPGTHSFFRAVAVDAMDIITWHKVAQLRAEELIGTTIMRNNELDNVVAPLMEKLCDLVIDLELANKQIDEQRLLQETQQLSAEKPFDAVVLEGLIEKKERLLTEIAQSKVALEKLLKKSRGQSQVVAPMSKKKVIQIAPTSKYVLIYPVDLTDVDIELSGGNWPRFISKIGGRAYHFIKTLNIQARSNTDPVEAQVSAMARELFARPFTEPSTSIPRYDFGLEKIWLFKELKIMTAAGQEVLGDVVIKVASLQDGSDAEVTLYYTHAGKINKIVTGYVNHALTSSQVEADVFVNEIKALFQNYEGDVHQISLFEATGGHEGLATIEKGMDWFLTSRVSPSLFLDKAIRGGNLEELRRVLARLSYQFDVTHKNSRGDSLLLAVVKRPFKNLYVQIAMMRELIGAGDQSQLLNAQDSAGMSVLHRAVESEKSKLVEALLAYQDRGLNVAIKQPLTQRTPLHAAVIGNQVEMVEALLRADHSSDHINSQDCFGLTPLHFAVNADNVAMVRLLLTYKNKGLNIALKDRWGRTSYDIALERRISPEITEMLEKAMREWKAFWLRHIYIGNEVAKNWLMSEIGPWFFLIF